MSDTDDSRSSTTVESSRDHCSFRTDSDRGMPQSLTKPLLLLSEHLQANTSSSDPSPTRKRRCNRPGKDIRKKQHLEQVGRNIKSLLKDDLAQIEQRWMCSLKQAFEKSAFMQVTDKNKTLPFFAILFSASDSERGSVRNICDDPDVYPFIRHGGPWSQVEGLLDDKYAKYLAGSQSFLQNDWKYDSKNPNLTLVWIIYRDDGAIVGRGGLQPEDDVQPPMTEPFVALKKEFWGMGLATTFFRECLIPFYNTHTGQAPMRILALPENKASQKIAFNTELQYRKFEKKESIEAWGKNYDVFESVGAVSNPEPDMD